MFAHINQYFYDTMGTEGIRDRYINPYTDFGFK